MFWLPVNDHPLLLRKPCFPTGDYPPRGASKQPFSFLSQIGLDGEQSWLPIHRREGLQLEANLRAADPDREASRSAQPCRAAFLRIVSPEAWSFGVASDRRFETSTSTCSSVAFSCSSR